MSFLAPLFLLGALAVALPVVFHLMRRTTRQRNVFSSLMFLLPTPPRLTRRSRLEDILLLALRCLLLCLLALGFARPFFRNAASGDQSPAAARRILVLVDTSASMRRANLWSDARQTLDSLLRKTSPADQVAVFTFDRQVKPCTTFAQWNAAPLSERVSLVVRRLADSPPGWSSTHLGNALITAAETLADTAGKPALGLRQIVLLSDLQEGSRLDQLQGYEWPKGIAVSIEPLKARHPGNAGLQLLAEAEEADRKSSPGLRVRVDNATDSPREQFKLGWARADGRGFSGAPADVYVPPGQSRVVLVPLPSVGRASRPGEPEPPMDRIVLQGDEEEFDNTVFAVPPEATRLEVLYLGGESRKDARQPLYFLERAFQETRHQAVRVLTPPPGAALPSPEEQAATLVIVTDALPEARARALHDQIAAGKTLLFALRNQASAATLARLLGRDSLTAGEARPNQYALLAEIDFQHPLFAPFADPRFSDFTKIHFWKYRRLDAGAIPGARVLAKFDTGDPALLEAPVGRGRVLVLASCWHPEDSQLALSTKFVPWLYSVLDYSGAAAPLPVQYHVGDVVPRGSFGNAAKSALTIVAPDGSRSSVNLGETNFSRTMAPGIYSVTSAQPPKRFAVNLEPAESRTAPLPVDELERLGVPVRHPAPAIPHEAQLKVQLQNAELENRQKLWRWVLVAAVAVLLLETWLAGHTARQKAAPGEIPA